jgi:hypothetical protein
VKGWKVNFTSPPNRAIDEISGLGMSFAMNLSGWAIRKDPKFRSFRGEEEQS